MALFIRGTIDPDLWVPDRPTRGSSLVVWCACVGDVSGRARRTTWKRAKPQLNMEGACVGDASY